MKRTIYFFSFFCVLLYACKQTPPVIEDTASHLPTEVAAILEAKCAVSGCHNAPPYQILNLENWRNIFEGSPNVGSVVIPYNANWSHVFQHVNSFPNLGLTIGAEDRMPPAPAPSLSESDVLTIKNWIMAGAKSDKGEYYWAEQEKTPLGKLFVLCAGSDLIAVTDVKTNKVMRYVSVGQIDGLTEAPHYILISPDKKYFYVSLIEGRLIEKYSTIDYKLVGRVQVASNPSLIVSNASGNRIAVSHFNDDVSSAKLTLIDTENMSILSVITDDIPYAHGLTATPDFKTIFLGANHGNFFVRYLLNDAGSQVLDSEKFPIDPSEPVPSGSNKYFPYQIVMSPNTNKLFISCSNANDVRVYDATTLAFLQKIPTDSLPRLMTLDPVSGKLFVTCAKAKNVAEQGSIRGCVGVIDVNSMMLEKKIFNLGHRPHGLGVDIQARRLYVSSENTGGVDPPHHPTQGTAFPPGKYNVVDLNTMEKVESLEVDIAEFPTSLGITE